MSRKLESVPRFIHLPRQSFFLLGPRGTGKSTWLKAVLPDALRLDLLRPEVHRELVARPERLRDMVSALRRGSSVVIDEVQRVPELLPVVHELVESKAGLRFALTGSSARKLRRGGTDLLAGRAVMRTVHPFMAAEWPAFTLAGALEHGLLPLAVASGSPDDVLRAYAGLYLEQEVKAEGLARDVGAFARFLEAVSFSHGQVLNASSVARECEVERRTVVGYLGVLEDLLLSFQVPVFTKCARRETAGHPKIFLFDAGVFRALRPRGPLDRPEEIEGLALEGLVAQHLRAWIAYRNDDATLSTWRTRSGVEVDFVVHGPAGFWAIDVKNSRRAREEDLAALRTFGEDYPEAVRILLHRGSDRRRVDGTWCVPVEEFLKALVPERKLDSFLTA